MRVIGLLDRNPIPIGIVQKHTSVFGSVMGLLALIVILLLGYQKIMSVLNRQTLYLNYYKIEQSKLLSLRDLDFKIIVLCAQASKKQLPEYEQMAMNRNYSAFSSLSNSRSASHTSNGSSHVTYVSNNNYAPNRIRLNAVLQVTTKYSNNSTHYNFYDLDDCSNQGGEQEQDYIALCIPQEVNIFLNVSGCELCHLEGNQTSTSVQIRVRVTDTSPSEQQQQAALILMALQMNNKQVNPKLTDPRFISSQVNLPFMSWLQAGEGTQYEYTMSFQQFNVSTDRSILPSALHKDVQNIQYWKHQSSLDFLKKIKIQTPIPRFQLAVNLKRLQGSTSYERTYKKIDTALAQILGISSVIGFVYIIAFGAYAKWSTANYLVSAVKQTDNTHENWQEKEPENKNIQRKLYLGHLKDSISCNKKTKQALKNRQNLVNQIMKCGEITQIYKLMVKFKQYEIKVRTLQALILEDQNLKKRYQREIASRQYEFQNQKQPLAQQQKQMEVNTSQNQINQGLLLNEGNINFTSVQA